MMAMWVSCRGSVCMGWEPCGDPTLRPAAHCTSRWDSSRVPNPTLFQQSFLSTLLRQGTSALQDAFSALW